MVPGPSTSSKVSFDSGSREISPNAMNTPAEKELKIPISLRLDLSFSFLMGIIPTTNYTTNIPNIAPIFVITKLLSSLSCLTSVPLLLSCSIFSARAPAANVEFMIFLLKIYFKYDLRKSIVQQSGIRDWYILVYR